MGSFCVYSGVFHFAFNFFGVEACFLSTFDNSQSASKWDSWIEGDLSTSANTRLLKLKTRSYPNPRAVFLHPFLYKKESLTKFALLDPKCVLSLQNLSFLLVPLLLVEPTIHVFCADSDTGKWF